MDMGRVEALPDTVKFRRWSGGVEIVLLKPPLARRSPKALKLAIITAFLLLLFFSAIPITVGLVVEEREALILTCLIPLVVLVLGGLVVGSEINWERGAAVLELRDGLLTLVRSEASFSRQWAAADLTGVQSVWRGGKWALRITSRKGEPLETLKGRGRIELDWTAGLLRAALAPPRPSQEAVVLQAGGECQICSSPMQERIVACAKCKTPHHEECWVYNGSCSTYGCREIRFVRPV